ncbi:hypothetical protein [Nocardia wallacei]|uniref:hypothetical protein n=1 Tax=Nocardia wallacei TaxID=480035 RepID=UPI00245462A6|nr:hypothetical protein [Nocardia wallacei]
MTAISALERNIRALELPRLGHSTVADHADVHVLGAHVLAIVMRCAHNTEIVVQTIRDQDYTITQIDTDRDVITLTI